MKVLFWIRKNKENKNGFAPIQCRITIKKIRANWSTGVIVPVQSWNAALQKITDKNYEHNNDTLKLIEVKCIAIRNDYEIKGKLVSPEKIKMIVSGKERYYFSIVTLLIKYLNMHRKRLEMKEIKKGTYKGLQTRSTNTLKFMVSKNAAKLYPDELTISLMDEFKYYMVVERRFTCKLTVAKHQRYLKNALEWAEENKFIDKNPFSKFKAKGPVRKDKRRLTEEQVLQIRNFRFANKNLEIVADCFVFCCYTGLSFTDLKSFNFKENVKVINGRPMIIKLRDKTQTIKEEEDTISPILPPAYDILSKYDFKLPVFQNAPFNKYLKEIAFITGLDFQDLSSKIARKTFGHLMANEYKIDLFTLRKQLGHRKIETTLDHYADLEAKTVLQNIEHLYDKIK